MAKIANSVPLGGFIAPNDSADTYATHDEQYGRGGFRSVATTTERNAIPTDRRKEGMEVKVLADGKKYELVGGIANSNWQEVVTGGEVDPAVITQAVNNAVPTAVSSALETEVPTLINDAVKSISVSAGDFKSRNYRKKIKINGTGQIETDYIVKLYLHQGKKMGDDTGKDIFLDGICKTDFSDVRFIRNGSVLEHLIVSHANCEIIQDSRIGSHSLIHNGKIYGLPSNAYGENKIYVSDNNGETWTLFSDNKQILAIDSRGYFFARNGVNVLRSIDNGETWNTVLTLSNSGQILKEGFAEDSTGVLYAGQYQVAENAILYRSTDGGATWEVSWNDPNRQHFHGVAVDPYTDWVYAGIDDGTLAEIAMIRSKDHGVTWEVIHEGRWGAFISMYATPDTRFFAGGAQAPCIGTTIYKTTDDVNFEPIVRTSSSVQGMQKLGNHVYAFCTSYPTTVNPHIIQMDLDGSNPKIVWVGEYESDNEFKGMRDTRESGIPNGEIEEQLLVGYRQGSISYTGMRVYDGGDHYQAICHVKIPSLPANGTTIEIEYGKMGSADISKMIYDRKVLENPIIHYKFDEGEGTTVANSANVNPTKYRGTIIHTDNEGGWNNFSTRNCGLSYPHRVANGKSYNFNGDYMEAVGADSNLNSALSGNFTILAWIKSSTLNKTSVLFRKETTAEGGFRLQISGINGNLRFQVKNSSNNTDWSMVTNAPYGSAVGHECMIGIIVDNSTPQKIRFISNGSLSQEKELPIQLESNNGTLRIGTSTYGSEAFIGDIGEIQIYPYQLTQEQIKELYENRSIATIEPIVEEVE